MHGNFTEGDAGRIFDDIEKVGDQSILFYCALSSIAMLKFIVLFDGGVGDSFENVHVFHSKAGGRLP